ncbi:TetR/AcrR family transcriptional regulator [Aquabacter spiritensis]|uniref:TetR family transcriptional regulator n=1 Tax=Aquabacter spiritensis TaxID=933073 RepID=A0A4R3M2K1_9HYPH|nr:TetR/AcrR family transcriptional regulator [Aquabacter spiritensis]TCT05467.1 TetR family transcriptional regulator [Aquabacter spiritensis]
MEKPSAPARRGRPPGSKRAPARATEALGTEPDRNTREHLLEVAERLFACNGIDGTSMREINRAADQQNASAIHYYFGSKEALVTAILDRRMSVVNAARLSVIDALEAEGAARDLRRVTEAFILPLASQLNAGEGSNNYIRFLAQFYASNQFDIWAIAKDRNDKSLSRIVTLLRAILPHLPRALVRDRVSIALRQAIYALADWERDCAAGRQNIRLDRDGFIANLVDMTEAALAAPMSDLTRRLTAPPPGEA